MNIPDKCQKRLEHLFYGTDELDETVFKEIWDLYLFFHYVQTVFSQNGMGFHGSVFRQLHGTTTMTVKATESGTPLVAFVTGATPIGCVQTFWRLAEADRLKWIKDRYPWI